jgi:hypothetical protein
VMTINGAVVPAPSSAARRREINIICLTSPETTEAFSLMGIFDTIPAVSEMLPVKVSWHLYSGHAPLLTTASVS